MFMPSCLFSFCCCGGEGFAVGLYALEFQMLSLVSHIIVFAERNSLFPNLFLLTCDTSAVCVCAHACTLPMLLTPVVLVFSQTTVQHF